MDTQNLTLIISIIVAVIASIPGVWALIQRRPVDQAQIVQMLSTSAKDLLADYRAQADENEKRIKELTEDLRLQKILAISQQEQINILTAKSNAQEAQIEQLCRGAMMLHNQVVELGAEPVWVLERRTNNVG